MKTASELGREIAAGKTNPVELMQSMLADIEAHPARDQIFSSLTPERGKEEAEAVRKRQQEGKLKSPLDGVPISWKDLFDTKDHLTEAGSKLLEGRIPEKDCIALGKATRAGLVCIAKTHMSELAFSGLGINPVADTPPNIHGAKLAPGGSSSGAGSSVAHDLVPIGIGSDTGGSVRIPAAWNNLVGFKTTHGLISNTGVVPLCPGFDTVGPLCKSVEDAHVMTAIMAGQETSLPDAKPIGECKFLVNQTGTLEGLGEDQKAGFDEAVAALGRAGAKLEFGEQPVLDESLPLGPILFPYEAWKAWGKEIEAEGELMFEPVRNRFYAGKDTTKAQYDEAWAAMLALRETYNAQTTEYDAVLAPTVAIGPPNIEELMNDVELFQKTNLIALRNTRFFNMMGTCAMTIPTSEPASGLMVVGKPMEERNLVSVCLSVETAIAS